ncbi:MAG: hypothetical protein AAFZ99_06550 [Pseudomonadota bacterium]
MIAPEGYVTISEIAFKACNGLENYDDLLHEQLLGKRLIVAAKDGSIVSLDQRAMGRVDGRYAHIDPACWRVFPAILYATGFLPDSSKLIEASRRTSNKDAPLTEFEQSVLYELCAREMSANGKADSLVKDTSGGHIKALTPLVGAWICVSDQQGQEVVAQVSKWRNENLPSIDKALEACKQYFLLHGGLENQPPTNRDQILIRELEHAVSLVSGNWQDRSFVHIHKALRSGELVAETLEGQVVPPDSWPKEAGYQGSGWTDSVPKSNVVQGFKDKLLFVPRVRVREWLSSFFPDVQTPRPDLVPATSGSTTKKPKAMARAEAARQFRQWVNEFVEPSKPNQSERNAWREELGISRQVYRELEKEHAPKHWSKPGAPKHKT